MMISPISDSGFSYFDNVRASYRPGQGSESADGTGSRIGMAAGDKKGVAGADDSKDGMAVGDGQGKRVIDGRNFPDDKTKGKKGKYGIEDPTEECQTCKNRKYKDGSDEMVSFKTAQHVSPENAASAVRAHEQEHVSNAYKKAAMNDGKVVSASVSIHMAVCPECGRTYVSGGTTATQIRYRNEENPYQKEMKSSDAANKYLGMNVDIAC